MLTRLLTTLALPPLGCFIPMLLGLLLVWRGRRRLGGACFALGFISLWALATPWVAGALVGSLEGDVPAVSIADLPEADVIVVLGGGIAQAAAPREGAELTDAADRVLHAARIHRAGKAPLILTTGGYPTYFGDVPSEAASTEALLVEWGVPEDAVIKEEGALDTHMNAVGTKRILEERGLERVILVTSAMHMPRSLATFREEGIDVTPAPTDRLVTTGGVSTALDWLPTSEALDRSRRALHEHLGLLYYRLRGWAE